MKNHIEVHDLKDEFYNEINTKEIDIILLPTIPTPVKHSAQDVVFGIYLTAIANVFNLPAGTLNFTTVREDEQYYESIHHVSGTQRINDAMKNTKGLPVGIQVLGMPYHEEMVLNVMKQLEENRRL